MTDTDPDYDWQLTERGQKRVPYDQCPRCDRYRLVTRRYTTGIINLDKRYTRRCDECKYSEDITESDIND